MFDNPPFVRAGDIVTIEIVNELPRDVDAGIPGRLMTTNDDRYAGGYLINEPWLGRTFDTGWDLAFEAYIAPRNAGLLGNDEDPESHILTASLVGPQTSQLGAEVEVFSDGSFRYDPTVPGFQFPNLQSGESVAETFTYRAHDNFGGTFTDTATVTITVVGASTRTVDAIEDSLSIDENSVLLVEPSNLIGNDLGQGLTVTSIDSVSTLGANVNLLPGGDLRYNPTAVAGFDRLSPGESLVDTFRYTATDIFGRSDTATVSITIGGVDDPPRTLNAPFEFETSEDEPLFVDFLPPRVDRINEGPCMGQPIAEGVVYQTFTAGISGNLSALVLFQELGEFAPSIEIRIREGVGTGGPELATEFFQFQPNSVGAQSIQFQQVALAAGEIYTIQLTAQNPRLIVAGVLRVNSGDAYPGGSFVNRPWIDTDYDLGLDLAFHTIVEPTGGLLSAWFDPEGQPLFISAFDQQSQREANVHINFNGRLDYHPESQSLRELSVGESLVDSFQYVVSDGQESSAETVTVTVAGGNNPPLARNDELTANEEVPLTFIAADLAANDSDIEGDNLSVVSVGQPLDGTVIDNGDGTFIYQGNLNFVGLDSLTYQLSDGQGGISQGNVTITVENVNDSPLANDDVLEAIEDMPLLIDVTALTGNDADLDNDPLRVSSFTQPMHGEVSDLGNGQISYLSAQHYFGSDSFQYTISDGNGGTSSASVSITVAPSSDSPEALNDTYTVSDNSSISLDRIGFVEAPANTDPNSSLGFAEGNVFQTFTAEVSGDLVTLRLFQEADYQATSVVRIREGEGPGGRQIAAGFLSSSEAGWRTISFTTPPRLEQGQVYTIDLSTGIAPNGDTSIVGGLGTTNNDQYDGGYLINEPWGITSANSGWDLAFRVIVRAERIGVLANDWHPDGASFAVSSTAALSALGVPVSVGSAGELQYTAAGVPNFDRLNTGEELTDSFSYTIEDSVGNTDTTTVSIIVRGVNDRPVAVDDRYFTTEDRSIAIGTEIGLLNNDFDVDNTELTASLVDDASHGTLSLNADGSLDYTPNPGFIGDDTFTYLINDEISRSRQPATVTITVGPSSIANRLLFYNHSSWDGGDPSANQFDDAAIATDKVALLPGTLQASFSNYSSFAHGINGVMIDIAGLPSGTVLDPAGDFEFRIGNDDSPENWIDLAALPAISIRPGAGTNGASRITLTWPDGTIVGQWLSVRLKATTNTGLVSDDLFYFGNAVGEVGDSDNHALVNGVDFLAVRANPRNFLSPADIDSRHDFNRDGLVDSVDLLLVRDHASRIADSLRLIANSETVSKTVAIENPQVGSASGSEIPLAKSETTAIPDPMLSETQDMTDAFFASYAGLDDPIRDSVLAAARLKKEEDSLLFLHF